MKKKTAILSTVLLMGLLLGGCGSTNQVEQNTTVIDETTNVEAVSTEESSTEVTLATEETKEAQIPDGVYLANFDTDSSMFHVSEACDGKGTLTVEDGKMTIHISLTSKNILNLYPGLAEDAQKDGAVLLQPTVDEVTYSDGLKEEVNGFDVPVPVLDEEFDLALIGKKGTWYDHKVKVTDPKPVETEEAAKEDVTTEAEKEEAAVADGSYEVALNFEGGSGKAKILSPATIKVENQVMTATVQWSSPNYDYMIVDGEKYLPVNTEGDSVFEIPVSALDTPIQVIGDTIAMSTPHEIEYTITFLSDTMTEK